MRRKPFNPDRSTWNFSRRWRPNNIHFVGLIKGNASHQKQTILYERRRRLTSALYAESSRWLTRTDFSVESELDRAQNVCRRVCPVLWTPSIPSWQAFKCLAWESRSKSIMFNVRRWTGKTALHIRRRPVRTRCWEVGKGGGISSVEILLLIKDERTRIRSSFPFCYGKESVQTHWTWRWLIII